MHFTANNPMIIAQVRDFVMSERKSCVSDREWQHRLKGYGYDLRKTAAGTVLTTLPHGRDVCTLAI
ncbi:MAG: hypothetical protein COB65_04765 [Thalassobium sp.]|uniref:hypothetical protein n=1 Tax=Octadecabacter sp. SW4 TaxID=2602067 RepID=UPI000C0EFF44|nr:hypothetical protein [Octadecabacter sp. SW4]PHQ84759.1 MAG: hypothetical protein COB65_04765 [Thalassobium sp.]QEE35655.1 hypothetical protein FTO60_08005 [Octadecabacter sp. SW4]|tara:strand:+ start:216 stop:413 length:198 start_codon:yes stop_codon:yes gene_type:complete